MRQTVTHANAQSWAHWFHLVLVYVFFLCSEHYQQQVQYMEYHQIMQLDTKRNDKHDPTEVKGTVIYVLMCRLQSATKNSKQILN